MKTEADLYNPLASLFPKSSVQKQRILYLVMNFRII